jgi:hypothetical protein
MEMEPWEVWVRSTDLHFFVLRNPWMWPLCETIHYIGLSLLLGTVGLFDLRALGMAKGIAPYAIHGLIRWGIVGFILNIITGIVFFFGHPDQYAYNNAFYFKAAFMGIAGFNILAFYGTRAFREMKTLGPLADVPGRVKLIAATSLSMWIGVLICGRLLTFFRPPFFQPG